MKAPILPIIALRFLFFLLFMTGVYVAHSQIITTVAGSGSSGYTGDGGMATAATMNSPYTVVLDATGNKYIADIANNCVRKVNTSGVISTFAGNGTAGFAGDGGPASAAEFDRISGIAIDGSGNIYVADAHNNRIRIINSTGVINTIAGGAVSGYSGDGGFSTAAALNHPEDVCCDAAGNIYIADYGNARVRIVSTSGIINTYAGNGSFGSAGDGGTATAGQTVPYRICTDPSGNLYISEFYHHKIRIVNPSGIINTFAGTGAASFYGDGGPATAAAIKYPYGVAADGYGDIFISDEGNYRIRKVNAAGVISTLGGNGGAGYYGDGGPATSASINMPRNVFSDNTGNVYFADYAEYVVRRISDGNRVPYFRSGVFHNYIICENASAVSLNADLVVVDSDVSQTLTWSVLVYPSHGFTGGFTYSATSTAGAVGPGGLTYTPASGYVGVDTFKVKVSDGRSSDTFMIRVSIVAPLSPGVITGPSMICIGAPATYTESVTGGVWSCADGHATVLGGVVSGVSIGFDTVRYRVGNVCGVFTAVLPISVDSLPYAGTIAAIEGGVCPGDTVMLYDTAQGGIWFSSNTAIATVFGVPGAGAVIGVSGGLDTIMYVVSNACASDTVSYEVGVNSLADCQHLGIASAMKGEADLILSPNPNCGDFTLTFIGFDDPQIAIQVADITGKVVENQIISVSREVTMHVAIAPGIYFVTATNGNARYTRKLVVE